MILTLILAIESDEDRKLMLNVYQEFYPVMKAKAYEIVKNVDDAEDIVHNSILRLISQISTLGKLNKPQLATYVVKTTTSTAIDFVRKNKKYSDKVYLEDSEVLEKEDESPPLNVQYEKIESYENMGRLLQNLSDREKNLLYYKYFLDYPDKKIAQIMAMENGAVRTSLSRIRNKVKKILINAGINEYV